MSARPLVGVTMGDPAGIGPEVLVKAASVADVRSDLLPWVFGDPRVLQEVARTCCIDLEVVEAGNAEAARSVHARQLPVLPLSRLQWTPGQPHPDADAAQLCYIETAVDCLRAGQVDAICTAPIHKVAIHRAGSPFAGHTDLLGARFEVEHPVMMLAGPSLKVVPLTVHVPLRQVPALVTPERLDRAIQVVDQTFRRDFSIQQPRIAVAGLNPHAGESGMFGDEERTVIEPAVRRARDGGISVVGPLPGDSVFKRATDGEFDVVIGMYHDQALTPLKLLDFDRAVNVTLGLPVIRTSVDHGTAYDIAGQGVASAGSMIEALRLAGRMVKARREADGS